MQVVFLPVDCKLILVIPLREANQRIRNFSVVLPGHDSAARPRSSTMLNNLRSTSPVLLDQNPSNPSITGKVDEFYK
jgi:hypothetical protein